MASSAKAGSITILQFAQANAADIVTATDSGGVTTLVTNIGNADGFGVSIPVTVTNFLGNPFPPIPVYETYVGVHSVGPATISGTTISQVYSGEIQFTSGPGGVGANYLTVVFSGATFSGSVGGGSATMSASEPSTSVVFTSDFAPPPPFGLNAMALGISGISPALGIAGGSVASYTAQNAGGFSTSIPEPGTITMASMAIVFGTLTYGRKRISRSKA